MADWIAKTRNSLRREKIASGPVPFERVCLCGERLVGDRDESPHSIVCGNCQRSWFVLPRDAYPWPKSRRKKRHSSRGKASRSKKGKLAAQSAATATATPIPRKAPPTQADEAKADQQPAPVLAIPPSWPERLRGLLRPGRLQRGTRPIRLIAGGILILFLLTGVWLWHQARVREAAATLVETVPAAEAAIEAGNLPLAAETMGWAVAALDILDADDATARRIRQRHRELVAITELASLGLYDLAAEAEAAGSPERWTRRFAATTAGGWVILNVPLGVPRPATTNTPPVPADAPEAPKEEEQSADPKAAPAETVIPLELPLLVGNTPVRLELEAKRFEEFSSLPRGIIAAQYASWRLMTDAAGQPVWVVRFNPRTAFFWTSPDLLEAAGFDLDDPLLPARQQLAKQAKILEIPSESASDPADDSPSPETKP